MYFLNFKFYLWFRFELSHDKCNCNLSATMFSPILVKLYLYLIIFPDKSNWADSSADERFAITKLYVGA